MTKRDGARGRGDEHEPTRISVKDNRRIDPKTGEVRASASGPENPGPGPDRGATGAPGSPSGPAGDGARGVIPGEPEASGTADGALDAARAEVAERTADLQRMAAEYANYRKRADRDKQAAAVAGKATVVAELLAILDDLDRAEEHGDLTGGFKTVADKLTGTLSRLGLAVYGAEGDEFDPNLHEAVQFGTSADVTQPTVTTVLRRGYLFDERVLRAAVVVVTGPEHEGTDGAGDSAGGDSAGAGGAPAGGARGGDGDVGGTAGGAAGGTSGMADGSPIDAE